MDMSYLMRFAKALENCHCMLQDRGFTVPSVNGLELLGQFYASAMSRRTTLAEASSMAYAFPNGNVFIWVFDRNYDSVRMRDRMISTDQVKTMNDMVRHKPGTHIVLSPNKLSPQAKKERSDAQVFLFDDLMINLPKHELVPKHIPVTKDHVLAVLGSVLNVNDLPVLLKTDPIVRWYNFKKGTLVKIENPMMPSYRIVA